MSSTLQLGNGSSAMACTFSHTMASFVSNFMVTPVITVLYRGRGRQVSTKPNVITRNDLLRTAEMNDIHASRRSSYSSDGSNARRESHRKHRRSKRPQATAQI
ncbi:uncharacterized protein TDEL_0D02720 [Torulaspora delbrueckii]|uniref:Uncharacterized protein n=1 Tax=Torulaspora delbrueckii TaxID=4950 RepID=G8ZTB2_TORDE|nr:hypothetical protein TDEL_0D02720 [Torulaspora delbrueckii]CCE91856.1 hypothetical protein TDEL_0D02720 [Torulaspora delbrueckii]